MLFGQWRPLGRIEGVELIVIKPDKPQNSKLILSNPSKDRASVLRRRFD
jgi:hypothetical protein